MKKRLFNYTKLWYSKWNNLRSITSPLQISKMSICRDRPICDTLRYFSEPI